CLQGYNTPVTF
nr:immunoglobulin light chain junction region [Macaca mulatta]MOV83993.1 immunoglobulin light chain junction region [Macaca mulatta]MOV84683.1 immunoglobulin light chain junction region [Macaca mulatta]